MKLLLDMNLPHRWVEFLRTRGIESAHWSDVGDPRAQDAVIMSWARERGYIVFTHDLDFSTLLALSNAQSPSILQVRTQNVWPESIGEHVIRVLSAHEAALESGAIVTVDEAASRVRILPLNRSP